MEGSILKDCLFTRVLNAVAAGQTDQTPATYLDMAGYDGVIFICLLGAVTDGSVLSIQGRESDSSNGSSDQQVSGSKTADVTAATSGNKVMATDLVRPAKRFVAPTVKRGTQNAAIDGVLAIQYRARALPVVQALLASALSTPEV